MPGNITLGDIMEILPFEDSILVLELEGKTIWEAFEAGLATWPAQEGYVIIIVIRTIYSPLGADDSRS